MPTLAELRDRHIAAATEAQSIIAAAEDRDSGLNEAETTRYNAIMADLDSIAARAKRIEETDRRSALANQLETLLDQRPAGDAEMTRLDRLFSGDKSVRDLTVYRERRAVTTVGPPNGTIKDLVAQTLHDQVMTAIAQVGGVLATGPTIINTTGGEPYAVPSVSPLTSGAVAEAAAMEEQALTSDDRTLGAFKAGALISVSNESLTDTVIDLVGLVSRLGAETIGETVDNWLANGTGTAQPTGIFTEAVAGPAAVAAISYDALVDLQMSVPSRSMNGGVWLMSRSALAAIRKLKDASGIPLVQPSLELGAPNTILGNAAVTDDFGPPVSSGNKPVLFGDFKSYFVRWAGGVRFERSDEAAFSSDKVLFRVITRVDGKLGRLDAVKALVIS